MTSRRLSTELAIADHIERPASVAGVELVRKRTLDSPTHLKLINNHNRRRSEDVKSKNTKDVDDEIVSAFWWRAKMHPHLRRSQIVSPMLPRRSRSATAGSDPIQGMNFIAKHFFEYQSFVNLPHKAVQLHKTPPAQAGSDPSASWAPKNMNRAGKNQPAPAARASRCMREPKINGGPRHGRAGKHEHRDWGDRHGELKEEKIAPHKDAWTKFLANEDPGQRTVFECDFEDKVLQVSTETLPERIARTQQEDDLEFQMAYNATKTADTYCELLAILTYAPMVQFVTATVKKAKALPFNIHPFARVMLFEGRRLLEQKQTTVTPAIGNSVGIRARSSASPSSSSNSSAATSSSDALFSESFLFHVPPDKLDRCHIVIEMFDHDREGTTHSVGHCVIGRMAAGTGVAHWIQMLKKSGLPVCMWHRIGA